MPAGSAWIQIRCRAPRNAAARIEDVLSAAGASSISLGGSGGDMLVEHEHTLPGPLWQEVEVGALFDDSVDTQPIVAALRAELPAMAVDVSTLAEECWAEAWKTHWQPQRFGQHLWVCPTWCEVDAADARVVRLDPGLAFGTGAHETTALCLEWIAAGPAIAGSRVIDFGCGSGVFALAAARCGARSVYAVDIDAQARSAAQSNPHLNDMAELIAVLHPDALEPGCADVLVANILLGPLLDLAPRFANLLPSHGQLLLSGVLENQIGALLDGYRARFNMAPPIYRGEWAAMAGERV